jgi:hypothetical protein
MTPLRALLFTLLLAGFAPVPALAQPAASPLLAAVLPNARSVQVGTAATIFATVFNVTNTVLTGCEVALPASAPSGLSLDFQTTDPTTNALTGTINQAVTIPQFGEQTFILSFQSTSPLTMAQLAPQFICQNSAAAPLTTGVNTVDLDFSATPVVDVIALAATPTGDGILRIPNGYGAFAVATIDAGAAGLINVSVDTGAAPLPLALTFCSTNPTTGDCEAASDGPTSAFDYTPGETVTYSIFVTALGPVPFDPGTARIFFRFTDSNGVSHGSTSIAVTTAPDF